ncbi:putative lachesin [Penaeus vannamei]|uniref:Putative lachesin n=1 Tax=Penaeus vannamei TaxID=6689 RepID=A0A3R7MRH7_PENVA|nr:putative lachesin [Penaeus vannamei]
MCQVLIGINNRITANVDLLVRRPPVISDNSTRSVVASENESVELGNVLQIANIRKEDRGTYYCIAENQVGRGARRNINVEVEFAPVVKATRPRVYQALQYDMDLECHVEAYPPAAITWIHKQEAIVNNQHYRVSQFATADEYTDTTLRVLSIEKRQFGNYTCMATNKLGQSSARVELIETTTPVCPPACGTLTYSAAHTPSPSVLAILALFAAIFLRI